MIIPKRGPALESFLTFVLDTCRTSEQTRSNLYDRRRRYFLYGSPVSARVLYNKLQAHVDLVASFLYAADHARFSVSAPNNSDDVIVAQMLAVEEDINSDFRDYGLAYDFATALLWALVYDSYFLKLNWNSSREQIMASFVPPHLMGVFDEEKTDLDEQEAFSHTYMLDWDNAEQRLRRAGLGHMVEKMKTGVDETASQYPNELAQLVALGPQRTSTGNNLQGQVTRGYEPIALYESQTDVPKVRFHELWVWDDEASPDENGVPQGDYAMFTIAEPGLLISDSRETIDSLKQVAPKKIREKIPYGTTSNIFLTGEHPFIHVKPYELPDYFWGEAHTERLMPLQDWSSNILSSIHEILEEQRDPPKYASGAMGLTDEKMEALHGPGSYVMDALPGFKVERLAREMPPDIFADWKEVGAAFLEASGLTETVVGKGEQGVRGGGHAKKLAMTGSGRIRKVAVGLEPTLVQLANKALLLKQRYDATPIISDTGLEFVLAQVATRWKIRIAGHSHSPLFSDEAMEKAVLLMKAKAIDRGTFIRMVRPPGESNMLHNLKKIEKAEAVQQQAKMQAEIAKKANGAHPPTPEPPAPPA
jgi:hypothetical protein